MFLTKVVEKIKTHILCSIIFSRKPCRLRDNVEKYFRAGQATDGNMAPENCTLDTQGYTHTLSEYAILIAIPLQQWLYEEPQCYVILSLSVLLYVALIVITLLVHE